MVDHGSAGQPTEAYESLRLGRDAYAPERLIYTITFLPKLRHDRV